MKLNEIVAATKSLLPSLRTIPTRFRAYQLDNPGGSYSYFDGSKFTLVEARMNAVNAKTIVDELGACGKRIIDVLHITSWDRDHCNLSELKQILEVFTPERIEYPGYEPSTDCGKECVKAIQTYCKANRERKSVAITPAYIKGLTAANGYGYRDVIFHPKTIVDKANDNSTVKIFRTGCFNVLSLGDVESADIAALLKSSSVCKEVDVLILPHHGADNGFLTSDLLDVLNPKIAICGSDLANQYGHPAPAIRTLLHRKGIELATTARGDVLVWSENGTSAVRWVDTKAGTTEVHKHEAFTPKKFSKLNHNGDSLRAKAAGKPFRLIK